MQQDYDQVSSNDMIQYRLVHSEKSSNSIPSDASYYVIGL
jgi:hypothetical protein